MDQYRNILLVGFRDKRHSKYGGYDRILNYPEACILTDKSVPLGNIPVGKRGKSINCFFLDLKTRWERYRYSLTHIIYGDAQIIFPYRKSKNHKIIATIHMNPDERNRLPYWYFKALRQLDGVIVLCRNQVEQLKKYNISATYIPHGFTPPAFVSKIPVDIRQQKICGRNVNVIFSGTNYRDYTILFRTLSYLENKTNIVFHIVGQKKEMIEQMKGYKNVSLYNRLSDDEYYTLISLCDYNFLPLTFATANNALLEAQFLGIKSILPNIGGINDYAAPSPLNFFYSNIDELLLFFDSIGKNLSMHELIVHANQFTWEEVYKKLSQYYSTFL